MPVNCRVCDAEYIAPTATANNGNRESVINVGSNRPSVPETFPRYSGGVPCP
jgi:hypothetical protein